MDFATFDTQELAVSFGSSLDAKEQVKQAIDIVDLIGRHIQLRRQGRNYVGLCPWHDDSRPSLQVNQERQSWKCWVCDVGGDVFSFVMKMDNVGFPEALAMLADQAGIALKPNRETGGKQGPSGTDAKRRLYQAMAWAETQYHDCLLKDPEAEPARRYLKERSITAESIEKFHLGYAPPRWDWLVRRAQGTPHNAKVLETIGILTRSQEGGNLFDRFRGRVLFSIRDPQNRPVGLGGRVLPESGSTSPAKYLNSPETPLFTKSSLLYGLDVAREAMRKTHAAVVMEGYTDCIVAHQFGFGDAVAVLGTALGERHVQILKRHVDRIILVLDGDEAGRRRTNDVLELFVSANVDLRIVTIPEEMDPAEFLLEHGAEAFRKLLDGAVDALEHAFRATTRGIDVVNDIHASSQALERLVSIVAKAPRLRADSSGDDRFREEKILQRLAASFRVPEQDVRARLTELRRTGEQRPARVRVDGPNAPAAPAAKAARPSAPIDPWQRELLEALIQFPAFVTGVCQEIPPERLPNAACREIYEACVRLADAGVEPTFARLMLEFDDAAVKSLLVELDEKGRAKGIRNPEGLLEGLLKGFRQREIHGRSPLDAGALRQTRLDESQQLALFQQIVQQQRARHGISDPKDG